MDTNRGAADKKEIFYNFPIKLHLNITDNNEECPSLEQHPRTCSLMLNRGSQPIHTRLSREPLGKKTTKKQTHKKTPPNVHIFAREWCVLSDLPGIWALIPPGTSHMQHWKRNLHCAHMCKTTFHWKQEKWQSQTKLWHAMLGFYWILLWSTPACTAMLLSSAFPCDSYFNELDLCVS